ncbi:MAG TPA: DoxX family protein [Steroidobacteraceae bacterium]
MALQYQSAAAIGGCTRQTGDTRVVSILAIFAARALLVLLFFPFSATDKILNFNQAVSQASEVTRRRPFAMLLIVTGMGVEICMSLAILTGFADRMAALILAVYCIITALLWKQFWRTGDFTLKGPAGTGRELFWDFLKNLAVAGGFLLLTFGATANGVERFLHAPFASSHPYERYSVSAVP